MSSHDAAYIQNVTSVVSMTEEENKGGHPWGSMTNSELTLVQWYATASSPWSERLNLCISSQLQVYLDAMLIAHYWLWFIYTRKISKHYKQGLLFGLFFIFFFFGHDPQHVGS